MDKIRIRSWAILGFFALLIIAILFSQFFSGLFISEQTAVNALQTAGYSEVQITNKAWFLVGLRGCAEGDDARFDARALNPLGQEVEVYVCSGLFFKGNTVRSK